MRSLAEAPPMRSGASSAMWRRATNPSSFAYRDRSVDGCSKKSILRDCVFGGVGHLLGMVPCDGPVGWRSVESCNKMVATEV